MKKLFKCLSVTICVIICSLTFFACGGVKDVIYIGGKLPDGGETSGGYYDPMQLNDKDCIAVRNGLEKFNAELSQRVYGEYDKDKNFILSPLSVYMMLSMAAEGASGQTREEILNALSVSYEDLSSGFIKLYNSIADSNLNNKKSKVTLSNSVWLDKSVTSKKDCMDRLAERFYAEAYAVDFANENKSANNAVRKYVKNKTHGLIDKDFDLKKETLIALMNTVYFNDAWVLNDELSFTEKEYDFKQKDGSIKKTKLLEGLYRNGRAIETDTFSTFYTRTLNGYYFKFIKPNDGFDIDDVFTAENIKGVNALKDYYASEYKDETHYIFETRCLFPEFEIEFSEDLIEMLKPLGIHRFFEDGFCEFDNLCEDEVFCKTVKHVAKIKVDKKGAKAAAVTIGGMDGATAMPEREIYVKNDFVLDRSFGFILTDPYGTVLFTGVVKNI